MQDHMTDAEKIEALRKWAEAADRPLLNDYYLIAVRQVRDIIDPPVMCTCGEQDVRGRTVQIDYTLHAKDWCGPCCTHGIDRRIECEQCLPPKWREIIDLTARSITARSVFTDVDPLADVLSALSELAAGDDVTVSLAQVVAICEAQVGDGWQADPERVHPGFWGVAWLLVPLSHEPPDWAVVGNRAAAWLRSLTDGGAA